MSQHESSAASAPCTRCGATPETGTAADCPECEGILEPISPGRDSNAAEGRAQGVLDALAREASREAEPWLTPASLRVLARENLQLCGALDEIARKARWYVDNGERLMHEAYHAFCVEVLAAAERALDV